MRIAIIGPLPPFRSGIAQHTMMLARALRARSELLVASFTRQYPRWLFPGATDRESGPAVAAEPGVRYLLDSLDPRTWSRTADWVVAHRPVAVVIPWWTIFWAPCAGYIALRLRRRGIPVHFLCHNVVDHEAAAWKRAVTRRVLRLGQGYFVQSEAEERRLRELGIAGPVTVHGHPVFGQFPAASDPLPRRAALELLFFGIVRPYKGLDVLLEAIGRRPHPDLKLTVAGEFWNGYEAVLRDIERLGLGDCVEVIPRYVDEPEAARLFSRADAVVMPYRHATGSGVLGLAYRYGKPVIASRLSGIEEHVLEGETGLLVRPGSAEELARSIGTLDAQRAAAMAPAISRLAASLTWESLADAVLRQVAVQRLEPTR
jgi:glycosyltransferase involved in cell wall biosynthesis